jgi:hypothetical protein
MLLHKFNCRQAHFTAMIVYTNHAYEILIHGNYNSFPIAGPDVDYKSGHK